ncbi:HEPN domain-containing protein [Caldivirga sp. UBA161]|uniref:HEPN domain-containing protein n=1 Tax=Caldivirga sp. UBA161 TaxID=1915569 RepID=UPI0025BCB3B4|nr:HEPN domain-containing protein [Caldivirga sp. UBA161]
MRRESLLWIRAAEDDLIDAEIMLKASRWFRVAFHAQQAVEEALKALFFIVRREEPPKIHTITELYRMLKESGFTLPSDLEHQLYVFNKYYTVTRYPDAAGGLPSESVDEVEARRALELAKRIVEYAKQYTGGGP